MSINTFVSSLAKTLIAPLAPAGTIAAFATTCPLIELSVETVGKDSPVGQAVKYPSVVCGSTVMFSEYACALEGILQPLDGIGNSRVEPLAKDGGPNAPVKP